MSLMFACNNCLENNWGQFKRKDDGTSEATCQECGYEISWFRKKYKQGYLAHRVYGKSKRRKYVERNYHQ